MKIIFVCAGNTCRSPMAEYLFNSASSLQEVKNEKNLDIHAESAGISAWNGSSAAQPAIDVMAELNEEEIKNHKSRKLTEDIYKSADLIVPLSFEVMEEIEFKFQGTDVVPMRLLHMFDPWGMNMQSYRDCRDLIQGAIEGLIQEIREGLW